MPQTKVYILSVEAILYELPFAIVRVFPDHVISASDVATLFPEFRICTIAPVIVLNSEIETDNVPAVASAVVGSIFIKTKGLYVPTTSTNDGLLPER
jgi:hypothetical protein